MKKLSKYVEFATTLLRQTVQERKFRYGGTTLKYMYQPCKSSDRLLVVFSACTRQGIPARYNYMRTLKDVAINKLFILDDFGEDHRGGYYLGAYPDFEMEQATKVLIDRFLSRPEINKICFGGSSKGGWSALNFGVQYAGRGLGAEIIAGAPQFWLGRYLMAPANEITLRGISNGHDRNKVVAALDRHLRDNIEANEDASEQKVFLHYSTKEHTYADHIRDLLEVLRKSGYVLIEDKQAYTDHGDVSLYFPSFFVSSLAVS
ncbi:Two component regulator three Y domain-containing protein [Bifidobacterium callimiconis]|uniref:EpsK n=1 Tax=Bifidobacterium callimiconis TaxID=2306973 RepID=A0A430FBH4_9BIFI|nr:Two component regulator three Y domain-containing protein [Bifidobacterium callimiconis]RSX50196.1 EpsK [Bifidobacterium callimiconis]